MHARQRDVTTGATISTAHRTRPMCRCVIPRMLIAFCLAPAVAASFGQENGAPRDALLTSLSDRVSLFFEGLGREQTPEAFRELLVDSSLLGQEEALRQLVAQAAQLPTKYGRYRGAEQVGAQSVGQDLVLLRYLGKHDQCPVVWTFVFYRPPPLAGATPAEPEKWRIVSIRFHTEWEQLWDAAR